MATQKYKFSDKLAVAVAWIGTLMAIILLLVDKTPGTTLALLTLMGALARQPILHFACPGSIRAAAFFLVFVSIGAFGWIVWPEPVKITPESFPLSGEGSKTGLEILAIAQKLDAENKKLVELVNESANRYNSLLREANDSMAVANARLARQSQINNALAAYGLMPRYTPPQTINLNVADCTKFPALSVPSPKDDATGR